MVVGREREAILIYTNTPKTMDEPIVNYSDAEEEEDVPTEASVNPEKENSLRARSFDPECKGAETKDPRGEGNRITKKARKMGTARNTESFDPQSTLVRPDFRVQFGSNKKEVFDKKLKHDDVIMVPEFFCAEDDWGLYYKLVEEIGEVQKNEKKAEWISWHEGAHLISKAPEGSSTFDSIVKKMLKYYNIDEKKPYGTRFNWYVDSSDWKPFHHDSAAFNPQRARSQDITIGASFGATRELAFIHATPQINNNKVRVRVRVRVKQFLLLLALILASSVSSTRQFSPLRPVHSAEIPRCTKFHNNIHVLRGGGITSKLSKLIELKQMFDSSPLLSWTALTAAISIEVGASAMMKTSSDSGDIFGYLMSVVYFNLSLAFFSLSLNQISVGLAYAVWSALGTAMVYAYSVVNFDEPINLPKGLSLIAIIVGVSGLSF